MPAPSRGRVPGLRLPLVCARRREPAVYWVQEKFIFKGIKYPSPGPPQKGGAGSLAAKSPLSFPFETAGSHDPPLPPGVPEPPCYPPNGTVRGVPGLLPARFGSRGAVTRGAPACCRPNPAPATSVRGGDGATGYPTPQGSPASEESHPRRVGWVVRYFSRFGEIWRSCREKRQSRSLSNGSPEECFTRRKILLPAP